MQEKDINEAELLGVLRVALAAAASTGVGQNAWAREKGLDKSYLSRVLHGKTPIYTPLMAALGYSEVECERRFRRVK